MYATDGKTMMVEPHESGKVWQIPEAKHPGDCGMDLYVSERTVVYPMQFTDIPNNISVQLPVGYWALIIGRSSTFRKRGLLVLPSVIDNGYRGPLFSGAFNLTKEPVVVAVGERVAQMILLPITVPMVVTGVGLMEESERGKDGFGSTGR